MTILSEQYKTIASIYDELHAVYILYGMMYVELHDL